MNRDTNFIYSTIASAGQPLAMQIFTTSSPSSSSSSTPSSLSSFTQIAPHYSSLTEHIKVFFSVTKNNSEGKIHLYKKVMGYIVRQLQRIILDWHVQYKRLLVEPKLKLFLMTNGNRVKRFPNWHKMYQLFLNSTQSTHILRRFKWTIDGQFAVELSFMCRWLLLVVTLITSAFVIRHFLVRIHLIVELILVILISMHLLATLVQLFGLIYLWKLKQWPGPKFMLWKNTDHLSHKYVKTLNLSNEIAMNSLHDKKCMMEHQFVSKKQLHFHARYESMSTKQIAMNRLFLKPFLSKSSIKCHSTIIIVRMVQIVMANDQNLVELSSSSTSTESSTAEPVRQIEHNTNALVNGDVIDNSSTPVIATSSTKSADDGNAPSTVQIASTNPSCDSNESGINKQTLPSNSNKIFTAKVSTYNVNSNNKSNVIMVKRSKLKEPSNGGITIPVSKRKEIKSQSASQASASVIIMNKSDRSKNGSNVVVKSEMTTETSTSKTNHLLRILNSPPKPINTSTFPSFSTNLKRTITTAQSTDVQKSERTMTSVTNIVNALVPVVKSENTQFNLDQSKLRHLLNDQNGNKRLNNNLFICKTDGKMIRLTPLMGSNCFNNVTTTDIQATPTNDVKLGPDIQHKAGQTICSIILEKNDSIPSKSSPPPLTISKTSTKSVNTISNASDDRTHSVLDELFASFVNTKDTQNDNNDVVNDDEKKNRISLLTDGNDTNIIRSVKSNFFSIASPDATAPKKQTTFIHRQNSLLKTESLNTVTSVAATTFTPTDKKISVKPTTVHTTPTVYFKQFDKNSHIQTKPGLCEILVSNENDLKILQKSNLEGNNANTTTATIANPTMNQIHIFPLISSNGRKVSISSAKPRTNMVRPQVIITGSNATDTRTPKCEPEKRNLVDQLREFDMVMEQIKEEQNSTNEVIQTDKLMLNNLGDILNHHIIESGGQVRSVGLPQKINLAIIKKTSATKTVTTNKSVHLNDVKRKNGAPLVVATTTTTDRISVEHPSSHDLFSTICEQTNSNTMVDINANSNTDPDTSPNTITMSEASVSQSSFDNITSVKINSPGIKIATTQTQYAQNAAAKHPPKSQEDEQTVQRIYDILAQYAEQISSSPDLNNKPAPRRRSNLVTIQSPPIISSNVRTVSAKISSSSTSSTTMTSMLGSSSNSNSSNESFQGGMLSESRKRTFNIQNDDTNASERSSNIDTITIHQSAEKKRRISNINLDGNDYILTTVPSMMTTATTYTSFAKTSASEMLKGNNQILFTQSTTEGAPALVKSDAESINANGTTPMVTKLKPLTIGIGNSSTVDPSTSKTLSQSPTTILLSGVSVVVSSEQHLPQTQTKFINTIGTAADASRFCGLTTGFPCKINITTPNKCQPMKQCQIGGRNFRNDNYILPMGILKYEKSPATINEQQQQQKISQIMHPNMARVVIPSANVHRELGANVKIVSDCSGNTEMLKTPHFQFNVAKKCDNFSTNMPPQTTPTLLLRTLTGTNTASVHGLNKKSDSGQEMLIDRIDNTNETTKNLLTSFTSMNNAHQKNAATSLVDRVQLSSQIFQSNRGILILDSNKYATLLTTNCTIPTTTPPFISETKSLVDIKPSNAINEPKVTAFTTQTTTNSVRSSAISKLYLKVPMCENDSDFLLGNDLNVDSPPCDDVDGSNEPFDDLQLNEPIFSPKTLPTLYDGEYSKNADDMLIQNDHQVIGDSQELIFHHRHDKSNDNVVIMDKQKSDTLTLNPVSSETRLNARTNSIIERELRLQKSLSEECEDLGVDEPSTSELFPDAFISF